ncbi:phosphotransferase [Janibacter sp. DB-40]|uniref:phosphotransferase n=1 Tax=Janibacter sp. DB-40 TaxID=3028808 RepID=UPI00240719F9|nr:phosphotransferase [Janibacter sp. DB-40]
MTSRGPLTLAALASAAVPGLDPDTVQGVVASGPADAVEVAFIQDREHRRWVIRCPRTPAASAQLERSAALLAVLARRLTMPVPAVKGWAALPEGGRAAVHSYLTGRPVSLEGIEPRSALARGLGRALAHLHNLDARMYEEAGVPVYDASGYRSRRLAELDRAAATGRVPTGLLARWERVLDDESLWTFTATPTHGDLADGTILATPDDGDGPDIKAFLGWESAQVADPADDIAPLLAAMDPEAFDTVMEAYAHTRVERPDRNLHRRAEVVGEMQLVRTMMSLVAAGDHEGAERSATRLRRLDERIAREEDEAARLHGPSTKGARGPWSGGTAANGDTATDTGHGTSAGTTTNTDHGTSAGTDEGTATTQPVATGASEDMDRTQPVATGTRGTSAEPSGTEDDDAVQVEHPAKVTPVARDGDDAADADADDTAAAETAGPRTSDPDTAESATAGARPATAGARPGTAETTGRETTSPDTAGPARREPEDTPDSDEPDTNPGLRVVPDPETPDPETPATETPAPATGRARRDEHQTAEIVPINDDDDDDVVPPRR